MALASGCLLFLLLMKTVKHLVSKLSAILLMAMLALASCGDDKTEELKPSPTPNANGGTNNGGSDNNNNNNNNNNNSDQGGSGNGSTTLEPITYTLSDNVVEVKEELAKQISKADTAAHTFLLTKVAESDLPQVGQSLIINTPTPELPSGLLAKVKSVTKDGDGYKVTYEDCKLTDVFKDLYISERALPVSEHISKVYDADGNDVTDKGYVVRGVPTRADNQSSYGEGYPLHVVTPEASITLPSGLKLTPHVSVDLLFKMFMKIEESQISTIRFRTDVESYSLGFDITAELGKEFRQHIPILSTPIVGIIVGPVVITFDLDFGLVFTADGKLSFEMSVSYACDSRASTSYLQYNEVNGLSGGFEKLNDGVLSFNFGPKLEGGLGAGVRLGGGVSAFGKVLRLTSNVDLTVRAGLSGKINLIEASTSDGFDWMKWKGLELGTSFNTKFIGESELATFKGFSVDLAELSYPIASFKMLPSLVDGATQLIKGKEAFEVVTKVKDKHLFGNKMWCLLKAKKSDADDKGTKLELDFDKTSSDMLNWGGAKDVEVSGRLAGKDHNFTYAKFYVTTVGGFNIPIGEYEVEAIEEDEIAQAMREILLDIYSCAGGDWKDCDWTSAGVPVNKMKYISEKTYNGVRLYEVTIPDNWQLSSTLEVPNHSQGIEGFEWEIFTIGAAKNVERFIIHDVHFSDINMMEAGIIKHFEVHSPLIKDSAFGYFTSLPASIQTLDLSGTSISYIVITDFGQAFKSLTKLNVANCKQFNKIDIYNLSGPALQMPELVLTGCDSVSVMLNNMKLHPTTFTCGNQRSCLRLSGCPSLGQIGPDIQFGTLQLDGKCQVSGLTLNQKSAVKNLILFCKCNVDIQDCKSIKYIDIQDDAECSLTVKNCENLVELNGADNALVSLAVDKLPKLEDLFITNNPKLSGVMPALFDELIEKQRDDWKARIEYDIRYEYQDFKMVKDKGYGYYYSDEPGCGYHFR